MLGRGWAALDRRIERLDINERRHRFTFTVESAPTAVTLDPNVTTLMSATFDAR